MVSLCDTEGLEAWTDISLPVKITCVHGFCGETLSCELLYCEGVGQLQVLELPTSTRVMPQKTLHWHVRLNVITASKRLNVKFVPPHAYTPSADAIVKSIVLLDPILIIVSSRSKFRTPVMYVKCLYSRKT